MQITSKTVAFTTMMASAMVARNVHAFAPGTAPPQHQRHVATLKRNNNVIPSIGGANPQGLAPFESSNTALFAGDNNDNNNADNQLQEIQKKAEEYTKFLVVDPKQVQEELAKNWGWIVASGVLTMTLGVLSLTTPIFTTGVAYDFTVFSIAALGIGGLLNVFVSENGHKLKSGISGLGYSGLAYYMATHPAQGLDIITLTIATVIASEGLYEAALAIRNKNVQGRAWHFTSGVVSTLAGLWLSASIPAASLVAPGAALGTRLTSNGASKVAIGLTGKEIADKKRN